MITNIGIVKYAETLWIIGGEQGNGLVAGIYKLKPQQDDSFCWDEGPELKVCIKKIQKIFCL